MALAVGIVIAGAVFGVLAVSDWSDFSRTWVREVVLRESATSLAADRDEGTLRATVVYFVIRSPLLLASLAGAAAWLFGTRRVSRATVFAAAWCLVGIFAMSIQGYSPQRYYTPVIPFGWLWVFLTLEDIRANRRFFRAQRFVPAGLLAVHALVSLGFLVGYYYVQGYREVDGPRLAEWLDQHVQQNTRVLVPFRLALASNRIQALGFQDDAVVEVNPEGLEQRRAQYVVTAPETQLAGNRRNLLFVETDTRRYQAVARLGDITIYKVGP